MHDITGRGRRRTRAALALLAGVLAMPGLAAAPAAAVSPGNNGKIVFVSRHERAPAEDLYTMDPDGSNVVRITNDAVDPTFGLRYFHPAWSPNGSRIAAFRAGGEGVDLVIMNADGSSPVVLDGIVGEHPAWSADGSTIFFADGLATSHLWRIGANGSGLTQVTTGAANHDREPAINPAGTKIAFVRNHELATANIDGSGVTIIAPGAKEALDPSWSPDGTKIAFQRTRFSHGVWVVNANGTGLTEFLPSMNDGQPAWSPDGKRLVVTGDGDGTADLRTATASGCFATLFSPGGVPFGQSLLIGSPDWQPVANPTLFRIPEPAECFVTRRGVTASTTVSIVRSGGFTGPVGLSAANVPPGMTVSFSPNPATGSTSTMTVRSTECPNPTPTGSYRLRITGVNGATTRVGYLEVAVNEGPPRMTMPPTSSLVAGATATSTKVPVKTSWLACDGDAVDSYTLQRYVSSWASVHDGTSLTNVTQSLTYGTDYRYRARARDFHSQTSAYAYGPFFDARLTQQTSTSVTYTGTWSTSSSTSYLGGSTRRATAAGASASYTFTGSSIAWVGAVGPTRGQAKVYVDGVLKATVNTYAATTAYRRLLYAFNWSSQGTHTIKVVVVGTPGHARVDVDGFVRLYRT